MFLTKNTRYIMLVKYIPSQKYSLFIVGEVCSLPKIIVIYVVTEVCSLPKILTLYCWWSMFLAKNTRYILLVKYVPCQKYSLFIVVEVCSLLIILVILLAKDVPCQTFLLYIFDEVCSLPNVLAIYCWYLTKYLPTSCVPILLHS